MPKHNCRFHNAPKSVLKSTIINNRINNSEGFLWKVYVVGIPTSIGFRMKLIQDYIYYDFISHAALRVKMIARLKNKNNEKQITESRSIYSTDFNCDSKWVSKEAKTALTKTAQS